MLLRRGEPVVVAIWIKNDGPTMLNGRGHTNGAERVPSGLPKPLSSTFRIHNLQACWQVLSELPPKNFLPEASRVNEKWEFFMTCQ
jgi:hypothetical protein